MKKTIKLQIAVASILAIAVVVAASRCVNLAVSWKTNLSANESVQLQDSTVQYLEGLDDYVYLTYVVTSRDKMPSNMKRVEQHVVELLKQFRQAAPDRIDFEILDPTDSDAIVALAAQKKVSQYHVENIIGDRKTETVVWSSLVISRGGVRDSIIHGITEEHIRYLEQLIVKHIENMAHPITPTVGVSAPPSNYKYLRQILAEKANVVDVDIAGENSIPPEIDMLYIMEPRNLNGRDVLKIRRFIDSGRTVVLADSLYKLDIRRDAQGEIYFSIVLNDSSAPNIMNAFGLGFEDLVLMDEKNETMNLPKNGGGSEQTPIPLAIKAIPPSFDLKNFAGQLSGNLSFYSGSIITYDEHRLKSLGYDMQTVITSSDKVWTLPLSSMDLTLNDLSPTIYRPKQPLSVLLSSKDPFKGKLLVFGSTGLFDDGGMVKPGFGHRVFAGLLGRTFLSGDELVKMRVDKKLPQPIPSISASTVVLWRIITILLIPFALLIVLVLKLIKMPSTGLRVDPKPVLIYAASIVALLVLIRPVGSIFSRVRVDFTEGKINSLSDTTIDAIRKLDKPIQIELATSRKSEMPSSIKQAHSKTATVLSELKRVSGGKIKLVTTYPDELSEDERLKLVHSGISPADVESTEFDTTVTKQVWHAIRLKSDNGESVISFIDERNVDRLEFFVMSALMNLERGHKYHIAIASDMPRLSPAEAYEDFFKKQLSAPVGSDVYSEMKRVLFENNFSISHVDPKDAVIPADTDLLVWFQPRRPMDDMGIAFGNHLAAGGKAIVAMQHFNIQQRQYSGRGFQTVYWPQPQYMDLNNYLRHIGVELVREVFMDNIQSELGLEMQINRLAIREYEEQAVAKPFLIRAIPPNFQDSPITNNLGDLLFIWGNRLVTDGNKMQATGLDSKVLITTSPSPWKFDWSGGFLAEDVFDREARVTSGDALDEPQALAMLVEGTFPWVHMDVPPAPEAPSDGPGTDISEKTGQQIDAEDDSNSNTATSTDTEEKREEAEQPESSPQIVRQPEIMPDTERPAVASAVPGSLLLIGTSEAFKNPHLREAGFHHDQFILNAVTYLTMGEDAVKLLAKKFVPKGFEPPDNSSTTVMVRLFTIFLPSIIILLFAAARMMGMRRRTGF